MGVIGPGDIVGPLTAKIKEREERNENRRSRIANSRRRRQVRRLRDSSVPLIRRLETKGIGDPEKGIVGIVIRSRRDAGQRYIRLNALEPREINGYPTGQRLSNINGIALPPVNTILDYFGFKGREREKFLATFGNQDYAEGVLRAAYHLAKYFGLNGKYENTEKRVQELFGAISYSVHKRGTADTDIFVSSVGLKNLVHFEDYKPMNIGGKVSLVQEGGLEMMTIRLGILPLGSPLGSFLMRRDGYSVKNINGTPIYSRHNH